LDPKVFEKIEEALKLDVLALQEKRIKNEGNEPMKKEEDMSMMIDQEDFRAQVK
jgi:hypothetical protein